MSWEQWIDTENIYERKCGLAFFFDLVFSISVIWLAVSALDQFIVEDTPWLIPSALLAVVLVLLRLSQQAFLSIYVSRLLRRRLYQAVFKFGAEGSKLIKSAISDELNSPFNDSFNEVNLETRQISKTWQMDKRNFWQLYDVVSNIYRKYESPKIL